MSNQVIKNDSQDLKSLVYSDKLHLLYEQSYPAIYTSMVTAIILFAILWPVKSHKVLLIWLSIMFITSLIRISLFRKFHKVSPKGIEILSWEKPYLITLTFTTLTWGIGSLFIMPFDSPLHQAIIMAFLTGLGGGAISFYSSHTKITIITMAVLVLPVSTYFFFSGNYTFIGLSIGALGFFISLIRASRFLGKTLEQNFTLKHQLEASKSKAEEDARIDHLTNLYNSRAFHEAGESLANISQRNNDIISLIIMDIDHFKMTNDTYGHPAGDYVLKEVAQMLKQSLRKSDICARIGGEEFAILLPSTTLDHSYELAEKIRQKIEQTPFVFKGQKISITASFGLSSGNNDLSTLFVQADKFLYQSKDLGRNTISCML